MPVPASSPSNLAPAPLASWADDVTGTAQDHETRIDTLEGSGAAVTSVNGETGTVVLDAADVSAIPSAALVDDDSFASATASNVPSAESVKAYVDAGGASGNVTSYVHDGVTYVADASRIFVGPEDPTADGFTMQDGDQWIDPTA